jgi:hypothetical protein
MPPYDTPTPSKPTLFYDCTTDEGADPNGLGVDLVIDCVLKPPPSRDERHIDLFI